MNKRLFHYEGTKISAINFKGSNTNKGVGRITTTKTVEVFFS
jgi:hypothetical protein